MNNLNELRVQIAKQILEEDNLEILEDVSSYYLKIKDLFQPITDEMLELAAKAIVTAGFASKKETEKAVYLLRQDLGL
jgi:hypothetical protein